MVSRIRSRRGCIPKTSARCEPPAAPGTGPSWRWMRTAPDTWDEDTFYGLLEVFRDLGSRPWTRRFHSASCTGRCPASDDCQVVCTSGVAGSPSCPGPQDACGQLRGMPRSGARPQGVRLPAYGPLVSWIPCSNARLRPDRAVVGCPSRSRGGRCHRQRRARRHRHRRARARTPRPGSAAARHRDLGGGRPDRTLQRLSHPGCAGGPARRRQPGGRRVDPAGSHAVRGTARLVPQ